jgi:hypothetical protein
MTLPCQFFRCKKSGYIYCVEGKIRTAPSDRRAYLAAVTVCQLFTPSPVRGVGGSYRTGRGGAVLAGSANVSIVPGDAGDVISEVALGGGEVSGQALRTVNYRLTPTGGELAAGQALRTVNYRITPTGGGLVAGQAPNSVDSASSAPALTGFSVSQLPQDGSGFEYTWDVVPGWYMHFQPKLNGVDFFDEYAIWDDTTVPPVSDSWGEEISPGNFGPGDFVYGNTYYFRARNQDTSYSPPSPTQFSPWVDYSFVCNTVPDFVRGFGVTNQTTQQIFRLDWTTAQPNLTINIYLEVNGGGFNQILSVPGTKPIDYDAGAPFLVGTTLRFEAEFTDGVTTSSFRNGQTITVT